MKIESIDIARNMVNADAGTINFITRTDGVFCGILMNFDEVREFGVSCHEIHRSKGGFKKWIKRGYIITHEGESFRLADSLIKDIKKAMKINIISTNKNTLVQHKYSTRGHYEGERKATEWSYKLKA